MTVKEPKQKITLRLSPNAMQTAQDAVAVGLAPNVTAFIEDAMRARAREVRHARMRELAREAMADPDFVADMRETMIAFEPSSADSWPADAVGSPNSSEAA